MVDDRSRCRDGPILEFIKQDLHDYAKHIQGSVMTWGNRYGISAEMENFFFFMSGQKSLESQRSTGKERHYL